MCGIVGYTGFRQATEVLMEGLRNLEYRGYDSTGVTVFEAGSLVTVKAEGRLRNLERRLETAPLQGNCGIAHTRWATHGAPSDHNAHPHGAPRVSLVHNGIVENYLELREMLLQKGYHFLSETDSEVAAKLLDYLYTGDPLAAIAEALSMIEGSYAFAILFADQPHKVFGAKKDNPLIAALGEGENFILSDIAATLRYTRDYYVLGDGEIVEISPTAVHIYSLNLEPIHREKTTATWNVEEAQRGGYAHFMLKEIYEQPDALLKTLRPRLRNNLPDFSADGIDPQLFRDCRRVYVVACGTAMYAGLVGKQLIEGIARVPVAVECASEFRYNDPLVGEGDLVIVISQSGETADSLAALRLAKERGAHTLAVVNVTGSSIAREAHQVLYTYAGPEIAVASTKAYTVQLGMMYLLAFAFALHRGAVDEAACQSLCAGLLEAIPATTATLQKSEEIRTLAGDFLPHCTDLFYIGRGLDYALGCEGSLKLKEITYIHSEAYPAGELKHGPISLITQGVPVIALATQSGVLPKTVSNMKEVKARGAETLLVCKEGTAVDTDAYDHRIDIPALPDLFAPLPTAAVLHLLAYHTAVHRGCDVDKPRNLAKSVTVE